MNGTHQHSGHSPLCRWRKWATRRTRGARTAYAWRFRYGTEDCAYYFGPVLGRRMLQFWLAVSLLLVVGCQSDRPPIEYGHRSGQIGNESLNGTAVFGQMFTLAGHKVESKRALTPSLEEVQTIVWFPDNYRMPSDKTREWLERWLWGASGRTLIYVGRGYDAEPAFWKRVAAAKPADKKQYKVREMFAEARVERERKELPEKESCEWFELVNNAPAKKIDKLTGSWAAAIDPAKAELEITQELIPDDWSEVMLEADDRPLVSREHHRAGDSWRQCVYVTNGSFLLNYSLVNREHRKLAGKLIELVGPGRVAFLESGESAPRILDTDPKPELPQALALFAVWPLNVILLHLAALGIIFGFARWPILGTPREARPTNVSNFADHASALGKLLRRTRRQDYAQRRLAEYRNLKQ